MNFNSSKPICFSMIADSRFDKNIKPKIERLHNAVLNALKEKDKFNLRFSGFNYLTFENGKVKQYRVHYKVEINKDNTKRNDLYYLVNSIKPVYYGNKWGD